MNEFVQAIYEAYENIEEATYDDTISNLDKYTNVVKSYFCHNDKVSSLLERVKEDKDYGNIEVAVPDLSKSLDIYKEYVDGIVKFMDDIKNANSSESVMEKFKEKLEVATEKNDDFIESLFGEQGEVNPCSISNVKDATSSFLEALTTFPKTADYLKQQASYINEREGSSEVYNRSADFLYESVDRFCSRFTSYVIDSIDTFISMDPKKYDNPQKYELI